MDGIHIQLGENINLNPDRKLVFACHEAYFNAANMTLFQVTGIDRNKKTFPLDQQKEAQEWVMANIRNWSGCQGGVLEMNLGQSSGPMVWSKDQLTFMTENNRKVVLFSADEVEVYRANACVHEWGLANTVRVSEKPLTGNDVAWMFP